MLLIGLTHTRISLSLRDDTDNRKLSVLESVQSTSMIQAFATLLADTEAGRLAGHMAEVNYEQPGVAVSGIIGRRGIHSKDVQFVLANNREVSRCRLHSIVKRLMSSSRVCEEGLQPVFVLRLTLPPADCDVTLQQKKVVVSFRDLDLVVCVLEKGVKSK